MTETLWHYAWWGGADRSIVMALMDYQGQLPLREALIISLNSGCRMPDQAV